MVLHDLKKNDFVNDLKFCQVYENFIGGIKGIVTTDMYVTFTLYDKSGEVFARIPLANIAEGVSITEGIYVLSFSVILDVKEGEKTCTVVKMEPAKAGDQFSPMDIYSGLSEEKISQYKGIVRGCAGVVRQWEMDKYGEPRYFKVLHAYFTNAEMDILSRRPASVLDCGRFYGGALALVANVAEQCRMNREISEEMSHGLYRTETDYSLMLTACLLCMAGEKEYVDDNMNKTQRGVVRGYHSLLQSRVEELIAASGINQYDGDRLLNTVHCMFHGGGKIKGVEKEATVCRMLLDLYRTSDMIDECLSEAPDEKDIEKGFKFSQTLNSYFLVPKSENKEA